jgi:hypothetical protein
LLRSSEMTRSAIFDHNAVQQQSNLFDHFVGQSSLIRCYNAPSGPTGGSQITMGASMRSYSIALIATSLASLLIAAPVQAQVPRTFVSATGSDSNNCANVATPCRHFQTAVSATAAGGEVVALDPANYGSVNLPHQITINGQGWAYVAPPNGGNAITVNAGSTDSVTIHGVVLDGTGATGTTNGIVFSSGSSLTVTDCVVQNFVVDGIGFFPTAASKLSVSNTTAINNGRNGIFVSPTGTVAVESVFDHVQTSNNADSGIVLDGANSTGTLKGTVYESVAAQNGGAGAGLGFFSFTATGKAPTTLMVFHSVSANNSQGLAAQGTGATLRLANSMITGNVAVSWGATSGGVLQSYGDNYIDGNGDGDPTPPTTLRK